VGLGNGVDRNLEAASTEGADPVARDQDLVNEAGLEPTATPAPMTTAKTMASAGKSAALRILRITA
jgi:hypothetical protein